MFSVACRLARKRLSSSLLSLSNMQCRTMKDIAVASKIKSVKLRENAIDLFNSSVMSVTPQTMVFNALKVTGDALALDDQCYILNNNVHVVAFGKAVIGMVKAVEDMLGSHIVDGVASVPSDIQDMFRSVGKWDFLPSITSKVKVIEGGRNNIPDENAHEASKLIAELIKKCSKDDIVLVLISGGGSALLPYPTPPITLQELSFLTRLLSKKGASIQQLNTVRKHLEILKGGGLAKLAYPAKLISLILSDVVDNDINFIASGPTTPNDSTPQQCLDLFQTLDLMKEVPQSVLSVLEKKLKIDQDNLINEQTQFRYQNVQNVIIGSNIIALDSASKLAEELGYGTYVLSSSVVGDAEERGRMYAVLIDFICRAMLNGRRDPRLTSIELNLLTMGLTEVQLNDLFRVVINFNLNNKPVCVLAAGETTVNVIGSGSGGRNQHMVLSAALTLDKQLDTEILNNFTAVFLSGGTDGQDGPTDAAGAICDPHLVKQATKLGLDPLRFLRNNDSYNFFTSIEAGRNLIKTGLTGTNVMDLQIILIASIT